MFIQIRAHATTFVILYAIIFFFKIVLERFSQNTLASKHFDGKVILCSLFH